MVSYPIRTQTGIIRTYTEMIFTFNIVFIVLFYVFIDSLHGRAWKPDPTTRVFASFFGFSDIWGKFSSKGGKEINKIAGG